MQYPTATFSLIADRFLLVLSCVALVFEVGRAAEAGNDIAGSTTAFATDLFHGVRKQEAGNVFFSPFSVNVALSVVSAGARGRTQEEMNGVMHLSSPNNTGPAHHAEYEELLRQVKGDENVTLETANRVYVQNSFQILDDYVKLVGEYYSSGVENANFADDSQRVKINSWVEERTRDKIRDLLPPGSVDGRTKMVLVNAVYFKGDWAEQFPPNRTTNASFHLTSNSTVDVQMMRNRAPIGIHSGLNLAADVVELPYKGDKMSMVLIVPHKIEGLKDVEAKLTQDVIEKIMTTEPRKRDIPIWLPKFKLESSLKLSQPLSELGMKDLFREGSADLSGITGNKQLYVSEAYHKAFLEVNEEGSEAAAATGVVFVPYSAFEMEVRADRPFLLLIKEKTTSSLLFMGAVMDPSQAAPAGRWSAAVESAAPLPADRATLANLLHLVVSAVSAVLLRLVRA